MRECSPLSTIRNFIYCNIAFICLWCCSSFCLIFFVRKKKCRHLIKAIKMLCESGRNFVCSLFLLCVLVFLLIVVLFSWFFNVWGTILEKIREFLYWFNLFSTLLSETMRIMLHVTISPYSICLSVCCVCTRTSIYSYISVTDAQCTHSF